MTLEEDKLAFEASIDQFNDNAKQQTEVAIRLEIFGKVTGNVKALQAHPDFIDKSFMDISKIAASWVLTGV